MKGKVRRSYDRRGKEKMRGDEMRGAGNMLIMTWCEGKQWNCKQKKRKYQKRLGKRHIINSR